MTIYAGQNFLLEMSDGGDPLSWVTLGAARAVAVDVSNDLAETTGGGSQSFTYRHPRREVDVVVRFRKPPVLTPRNAQYYLAKLELEVLP